MAKVRGDEMSDSDNVFRVSFKKTEQEQQLKVDILKECSVVGKSAWMKLAAKEKLERDKTNKPVQKNSNPVINDLSQLFK